MGYVCCAEVNTRFVLLMVRSCVVRGRGGGGLFEGEADKRAGSNKVLEHGTS